MLFIDLFREWFNNHPADLHGEIQWHIDRIPIIESLFNNEVNLIQDPSGYMDRYQMENTDMIIMISKTSLGAELPYATTSVFVLYIEGGKVYSHQKSNNYFPRYSDQLKLLPVSHNGRRSSFITNECRICKTCGKYANAEDNVCEEVK